MEEPVVFGGRGDGDDWGVLLHGCLVSLQVQDQDGLTNLESRLRELRESLGVPVAVVIGYHSIEDGWIEEGCTAVLGIPLLFARQGEDFDVGELDHLAGDPSYERCLELSAGGTIDERGRETTIPDELVEKLTDVVTDVGPQQLLFCVGGWNAATLVSREGELHVSSEDGAPLEVEVPLESCGGILLREYI